MKTGTWTATLGLGLGLVLAACGGGADPSACKPDSCSGHGSCVETEEGFGCECDAGYAGQRCDACAAGWADADGDGVCQPEAGCTTETCSGHGSCDDASGVPVCTCDAGYAGETCAECAPGYHDDGQGGCVADATCGPDTCSGHGDCDDSSGVPICSCDAAYAGAHCEGCAAGYQDNDGDGSCLPDCASAGLDCSGHGQCTDGDGEAVCICDEGHSGPDCADCAAGYQDADGDGACLPDCASAGLDCGDHGQCSTASGTARCECDPGWAGATCSECAPGHHPDGQGGCVLDDSCQPNSCNGHGQCDDSSGQVVCDCDEAYSGDHCELCAAGYQDDDADGTCLPDCASAGLDCGDHGQCSTASGTAACVCDTGYTGQGCHLCDDGYQDEDGDGSCLPDCTSAGLDCGDHGQCSTASGTAACVCDTGYTGQGCHLCDSGYQDEDGDGSCLPDCDTVAPDCSGHGQCSDASGQVVCICDDGYTGDDCAACAAGYQDEDGDGSCLPDCATAGLDCGAHGQCSDASGQAQCVCDTGYAGDDCSACAADYQDADGDGICQPSCLIAGLDCGLHGHCEDGSGTAVCVCDDGYTGADCTSCAAGYQDNDGDASCRPDCASAGLTCNGHGSCDDSDGSAGCVCEAEYTGGDCQFCAAGYQDNDGDGTCLADCATAGLDCGAHGHCDDHSGSVACICDVGYTGDGCLACAAGYQDNDGDGSCLPDCGLLGWTCSGHGLCDDSGGTAVCLCDAGYEDDGAGNCLAAGQGFTCADPLLLDLNAGSASGDTTGSGGEYDGSCRDGSAEEVVYTFTIDEPVHAVFDLSGSQYDTLLHLRSDCDDPASELACDDDGGEGLDSLIELDLQPGTYYLFIDGYGNNTGVYLLTVSLSCGAGMIYDPGSGQCVDDPCDPNPCQVGGQTVCEPVLPNDYSCNCDPGWIVDPGDPDSCIPDPNPHGEACADALGLPVGEGSVLGSTSDAADDAQGSCVGDGPDRVYGFTLAEPMRAEFLMEGYDTGLHLRSVCDDPASELACDDDAGPGYSGQLVEFLDAGAYYLWADSYSGGGDYELFYSFRADPCAGDPCPGTPECVAAADWSSYECVCPAGTLPYGDDCLDDPCDPNPCNQEHMNRCQPDLPGSYTCACNVGYIPDGQGGCMLDPDANEWAFIVFLNADNNLDSYGYDDVDEMGQAGSTPYVHIAALFDTYDGPAEVIYVTQGGYEVVEDWGEQDMSDWQTLRDFGIWAVQNYPARHYAFIMWDHGAGWKHSPPKSPITKGFSNDDHGANYEISISNGDYAAAMAGITAELGAKIDIVGFDACLMGMWEVAKASAPYAHYLVASEETEPAIGWPYHGFLPGLVNDWEQTPLELASSIVDAYYNESSTDDTLSVIDLDTMAALDTAVSDLADALLANPASYATVDSLRSSTQSFYYSDHRDLQDFAERVAAEAGLEQAVRDAAAALVAQLEISIAYNRAQSSHPGAKGMAIYFPASSMDAAYTDVGAVWSQDTTWDEFLQDFTN
jgi:hypothetical protein